MTNRQLFIACGIEPFKCGPHFHILTFSLHLDDEYSSSIQQLRGGPFDIWVDDNTRGSRLDRSPLILIVLASRAFQHATILLVGPKIKEPLSHPQCRFMLLPGMILGSLHLIAASNLV